MIMLDRGRKRSKMKHVWRANRTVLIFFILCLLKDFREMVRSIIMIPLAVDGLGIVKEVMVIASW